MKIGHALLIRETLERVEFRRAFKGGKVAVWSPTRGTLTLPYHLLRAPTGRKPNKRKRQRPDRRRWKPPQTWRQTNVNTDRRKGTVRFDKQDVVYFQKSSELAGDTALFAKAVKQSEIEQAAQACHEATEKLLAAIKNQRERVPSTRGQQTLPGVEQGKETKPGAGMTPEQIAAWAEGRNKPAAPPPGEWRVVEAGDDGQVYVVTDGKGEYLHDNLGIAEEPHAFPERHYAEKTIADWEQLHGHRTSTLPGDTIANSQLQRQANDAQAEKVTAEHGAVLPEKIDGLPMHDGDTPAGGETHAYSVPHEDAGEMHPPKSRRRSHPKRDPDSDG